MPGKAAKVVITERQQSVLQEFSKSRTESQFISQRASIILLAFAGLRNEVIEAEVGLHRKQVGIWRRRWQEGWDELTRLECTEPRCLAAAVREMLRDAPRSGCHGKFTAEQVALILAVACEPPDKSNRPITHWTRKELCAEVIKRKIVLRISVSQIGRYLNDAAVQPHRRKMWLNTTEKDQQQFQQQVTEVCQTYLEAPAHKTVEGAHTVCCDEMTGLQALERSAPDKDGRPGEVAKQEFEYIRHGTTTLIGSFEVTTGQLLPPSIGPTRTEADFLAHIQQTVATDPEVPWTFVVDGLNVHWSESLVNWIAEKCEPERPLGKKRQSGNSTVASDPPRISVGPDSSPALRVPAEAQFLAEPDRNRVRVHHAKSDASRKLPLGGGSGNQARSVCELLQRGDGPSLPVDLHRQAAGTPATGPVLPTPQTPAPAFKSEPGEARCLMKRYL